MHSVAFKNIVISFLLPLSLAQTTNYLMKAWENVEVFGHCRSLKGAVGNGFTNAVK